MSVNSKIKNRESEFKWNPNFHLNFVLIAMAFGITTVSPKQI
jgi:hypothetical protein